jgi:outer membrane protein assembly factor BamE (lipoprotein component of BamABCDE complex)
MKNIFIALLLLLTSCSTPNYLRQNLSNSYKLHEGMTKSEVEAIMGQPAKSDFYKNVEEWHYCATGSVGSAADELIALFFYDGKLIAKKIIQ